MDDIRTDKHQQVQEHYTSGVVIIHLNYLYVMYPVFMNYMHCQICPMLPIPCNDT